MKNHSHQDPVSLHKHQWQVRGLKWFKAGLSKAQLAGEIKGWNFPRCTLWGFLVFLSSSAAHSNCQWLPDGDQWGSKQSYQWLAHPQCGGELCMDSSWQHWWGDFFYWDFIRHLVRQGKSGESQPGIWSPHNWGHGRLSRQVEVRLSLYQHTRGDGVWHCSLSSAGKADRAGWRRPAHCCDSCPLWFLWSGSGEYSIFLQLSVPIIFPIWPDRKSVV